jgi:hypothetical protein
LIQHDTALSHDPDRPQPAEDPTAARARAVDHQRKDDRGLHARGWADQIEGDLGDIFALQDRMCDKCAELDKKIEHYSRMLLSIGDQITVERIKAMIGDLQAQKATHFILSKSTRLPR